MRHLVTVTGGHCCRPAQRIHSIPTLSAGKQHHPTPPHPGSQQGGPSLLRDYQPNCSGPSATFPGLPGYQKQCFKEKSEWKHWHLENKAWVNFVHRHTNILPRQSPACGTLPPQSLLRPPSPPMRGLASPPELGSSRLGMAWTLSQAEPTLHTTLGQSCRPAKLSSVSTRPGLIPSRVRNPLGKKRGGAAGIDKFKACHASSPPAALHPTTFLPPPHSPGINCPSLPPLQEEWRDPVSPSFYLPSSCHTNQGAGAPGGHAGAALPEVKFPFPRRQQLKGCPPRGHGGNPQGNSPHHSSPQT
ncbi:unnamed protein product [Nyctereutes procyonoides]|uniref:(raccoon dog) hypothetical protein n=1 Tax=Nyctereutes procyonoides TaxID=34880 RepID=A0A811XZU7_NYCPR|nr:unnamed protein product [Nyctereutes procyonoides]